VLLCSTLLKTRDINCAEKQLTYSLIETLFGAEASIWFEKWVGVEGPGLKTGDRGS